MSKLGVVVSVPNKREKLKTYDVLALVDKDTKDGKRGKHIITLYMASVIIYADIDDGSMPPFWPPEPTSLVVEDDTYDLRPVPLTSIAFVTNRILKVLLTHCLLLYPSDYAS